MKKFLSLILALIMAMSCASMIFADDAVLSETAPVEVDETASAYYDAVKFLVANDIMHGKGDGVLGVYDDIQRYEMALFIGRILTGWVDDSTWEDGTLNSSEFTDLAGTAAEKFYGAISYVNQKGVIEGYGNGKFGPTDGITYQDALTMAVRALGYNNLAYPWGYIEKAVNLGLTDGIAGIAYTDTLKREVVAQIIYNALFATNAAGDTLAKTVFGLDLTWTTIVIVETDVTAGVPAGYVGFSIFNADGTIGDEIYYVEAEQLGLVGDHDDEKAWANLYKVLFNLDDKNYGLNEILAYEALELETIKNEGRLNMTTKGYPIQAFLGDYEIVTTYTEKTFLNSTPEIILVDGNYSLATGNVSGEFAIDLATGNILFIDYNRPIYLKALHPYYNEWCEIAGYDEKGNPIFIDDNGWVNVAGRENDWIVVGYEWSVLYYYNETLDAYFQIYSQYTDAPEGTQWNGDFGIYWIEKEADVINAILATIIDVDYTTLNYLNTIEVDANDLNAYASLRVFDANGDETADYGIYDEYRFGVINNASVMCEECEAKKAGYVVTDLTYTPVNGTTNTALAVVAEGSCNHGMAWVSDGSEIVDGAYVIYGYKAATGELTIVKTIGAYEEGADTYVGYGYVRAYNTANYNITIGDEKLSYNYPQLKGSITAAMTVTHGAEEVYQVGGTAASTTTVGSEVNGQGVQWAAVANRFLKTLANQYVEYVVVDDRLVYVELAGASDDLIVVESYAGLHEDGTIVVWGYRVGTDATATKLEQFRINSYNGWIYGDWYNYSFKNEAVIAAAFERGAVYQIKSYDDEAEAYNVQVLTTVGGDYDYSKYGTWTELTYADAKVGGMAESQKSAGGNISRFMKSTDKYVFIYDIAGVDGYNAIPIVTYTGIVTDPTWYAMGYMASAGNGTYIMYIDDDAQVWGFGDAAAQGYGLFLFFEYGSTFAYDSYTGKNYLVGSTVYSVYGMDLVTGKLVEVEAYNANLVPALVEKDDDWFEIGKKYGIFYKESDGTLEVIAMSSSDVLDLDGAGSLKDQYVDNLSSNVIHINNVAGAVYQTVGGKIIDDTPVDPEVLPTILNSMVTGSNIFTDEKVLETGVVVAKYQGTNATKAQWLDMGWDNDLEARYDFQGFAGIAINRRMTLKGCGVAYHDLSPYTLFRKGKYSVAVYALRTFDELGRIQFKTVGTQTGNNDLGINGYASNYMWAGSDALAYWGDASNDTQGYYYSLIYNVDTSNTTGATKNDKSYAVVYIYDFSNDPALLNVDPYAANIDGFDPTDYGYEAYPVITHATIAQNDITNVLDNVTTYLPMNEVESESNGRVFDKVDGLSWKGGIKKASHVAQSGYMGGAYKLNGDRVIRTQTANTDASMDVVDFTAGDWTVGLFLQTYGITSDPAVMGTQCWDAGSSEGWIIAINGDLEIIFNFGDGNGDHRQKLTYDAGTSGWFHIMLSVDATAKTADCYVNFEKVGTLDLSDVDLSKLNGNASQFVICNDGDNCYADKSSKMSAKYDEFFMTCDVITEADVAALAAHYEW